MASRDMGVAGEGVKHEHGVSEIGVGGAVGLVAYDHISEHPPAVEAELVAVPVSEAEVPADGPLFPGLIQTLNLC